MPKRKLRIVREAGGKALWGVCEHCNMQFAATLIPLPKNEQNDVHEQFNAHQCQREDVNQAATPPQLIADGNLKRCSVCNYPFQSDVQPSMSVAFADHLLKAQKPRQTTEDAT